MAYDSVSGPFLFDLQSEEFYLASLVASDHELAYRLQLEEALAASANMAAAAVASSSSPLSPPSSTTAKESGFQSFDHFHAFEPAGVATAVAAGASASSSSSSTVRGSYFPSMDHFHPFNVSASTVAARSIPSIEDGFQTFTPTSAMASGANPSKEKGFQPTGCSHAKYICSDDKCFRSTGDDRTFVSASALTDRGISLKEEGGFLSTYFSHTFTPVSAMATGDFSSNNEKGFPLTDRLCSFIPASTMVAGGLSSKGKENVLSSDCFGTFVPGSAMAARGFTSKGEVEPFPSTDHSLALSLQSLNLSQLQQEAVDHLHGASKVEQNRVKIHKMSHDAELACHIHNAPDHEWEEHGGLLKNPLETAPPTPLPPPHLYFASIHCGEDIDAPSSSSTPAISPTVSFMGMVILDQSGNALMEMKKPLGFPSTKIESDYMALILSLEGTQSAGFQHVQAYTDSVLLYNQVKGKWKVYSKKILTLWSKVVMYIHKFQGFELHLLVKNENQYATRLARDAINSNPLAGSKNASSLNDNIRNVNDEVLEDCTICLEERAVSVMVTVTPCSHRFCMSCVVQHMEVKVQAGQVPVQCPQLNCKSSFSLEQCKAALSQKWFD